MVVHLSGDARQLNGELLQPSQTFRRLCQLRLPDTGCLHGRPVDAPSGIAEGTKGVLYRPNHCLRLLQGRRRVVKIEHEYASLVCEIDGKSRGIFPPENYSDGC